MENLQRGEAKGMEGLLVSIEDPAKFETMTAY